MSTAPDIAATLPEEVATAAGPVLGEVARATSAACPGSCNAPWRRAEQRQQEARAAHARAVLEWAALPAVARGEKPEPPEPHDVHPVPGDPTWCPACTAAIRSAVRDLDDLAALLAATADGHRTRPPAGRVSGTPTPASPSRAHDTLDELFRELVGVETWWRQVNGFDAAPRRGGGAHARSTVVAWLGQHLDGILARDDSVRFGQGILDWRARLWSLTRSGPVQPRRGARCPNCHTRALALVDGGITRCRACSTVVSDDEYERLEALERHGRAPA